MITLHTKVGNRVFDHDDNPFFKYPGGEIHMQVSGPGLYTGKEIALIAGKVDVEDYLKLQMWAQVVFQQGGKPTAVIPYLPAARADRNFPSSGLMYADLVNAAGCPVFCLDPHSDVAEKFYDDLTSVPSSIIADQFEIEYDAIIAPDKGAVTRAEQFAAAMGGLPVLRAEKERDFDSGNLLKFKAPDNLGPEDDYLFLDDICDGGRTFTGLSNEFRLQGSEGRLDLFVSHGIFSQGMRDLNRHFTRIYTTDSMRQENVEFLNGEHAATVIPVIKELFKLV